jgi:hypothetical protein
VSKATVIIFDMSNASYLIVYAVMYPLFWLALLLATALPVAAAKATPRVGHWQEVIRQTPYWESQGVHANLATIRRWVLQGESYCEDESRHILFDRRATFLGYVATTGDAAANQARLDALRAELAAGGRARAWAEGGPGGIGYPFALSCTQPDARLADALARYAGEEASALLWGTWDGMRIGAPDAPVSVHAALREVYEHRKAAGRIGLPEHVLSTLAGKVIIESGAVKRSLSPAGARGLMQLSPAVLDDCEIDRRFHYHRIAQIDCALRLLEQNHRNLEAVFQEHFGHLPQQKAETLYGMLLLQAYHSGVGRVRALLENDDLNGPARYFASHHQRFTAGDMALGMIFHNLGRSRLGFASLYYVTDVSIARDAACARLPDLAGCP